MRILFVENHGVFAATVIAEFLRGHDVTVTGLMASALERCCSERFDVVLVDYDLDDGKGDVLCKSLRAAGQETPIIAVSARDDGNCAMMAAGANATCKKADFAGIDAVLARVLRSDPSGGPSRDSGACITSTMQFDAEVVHDGFFHPERALAPTAIDAHRFHHISLPALSQSVMFCRIRVRTPGAGSAVHLIVYAHYPPLEDDVIARLGEILAAAFPAEVLSFTREMEAGRARVACLGGGPEPAVAAAVATTLAAAAWDESDPIVVMSGEHRFDVSLSFGERWHARVSRPGDPRSA